MNFKRFSVCKPLILLLLGWLAVPAAFAAVVENILQPDEAFRFTAKAKQDDALELTWTIADGYYLYRDKFKFVSLTPGIESGDPNFPSAEAKQDRFAGNTEIYRHKLAIELPLHHQDRKSTKLVLAVTYQGCAEGSVCYLPIRKSVTFHLTAAGISRLNPVVPAHPPLPFVAQQDRIAATLDGGSLAFIFSSFLGFGLLLAFTPCVFPMIPIISGIIVGQGSHLTTRKAFGLSLCYVLAAALTYTLFGVLAGLFGSNLQIFFQQPWVIVAMSSVFVVLAFSTMGVINLQTPAFIQTRIAALSAKQRRGNWAGAAVMGTLSALSIGPCVTAPLAGALIYIGKSGDALLGGVALFALGFGMGLPLLIVGTSAGKLLPRTGGWMQVTKNIFGFGLLAVALWLLGRILPPTVTGLLWGTLLTLPLLYLGWKKLWKITAALTVTYAIFLAVGAATRQQRDYMELLCTVAVACQEPSTLAFKRIATPYELQQTLTEAHQQKRWVMLEFYADWCVTCRELEQSTFSDPLVRDALTPFVTAQVDVTQNNVDVQTLLQRFKLIGPPAMLFFGPDREERQAYRIGYIDNTQFLTHLHHLLR
ncbi:MAG: protein-disulfide reductase DsbD [Gammaproteobacteria bacterium]